MMTDAPGRSRGPNYQVGRQSDIARPKSMVAAIAPTRTAPRPATVTVTCAVLLAASIGSPRSPELREHVTVSDFEQRCRAALKIVQRDLEATGHGDIQLEPRNLSLGMSPMMFAALPDGQAWSGGAGMTPGMSGDDLLAAAAESTSDVLFEVLRTQWPICALHGGPPMEVRIVHAVKSRQSATEPWWWCAQEHSVARVGDLNAKDVTAEAR